MRKESMRSTPAWSWNRVSSPPLSLLYSEVYSPLVRSKGFGEFPEELRHRLTDWAQSRVPALRPNRCEHAQAMAAAVVAIQAAYSMAPSCLTPKKTNRRKQKRKSLQWCEVVQTASFMPPSSVVDGLTYRIEIFRCIKSVPDRFM